MRKNLIGYDELHEILDYDPEIGVFRWKKKIADCIRLNKEAGCNSNTGYVFISIKKEFYLAHRLAWFYVHGYWPENDIDHINRIRDDNRICNLREVSRICNVINSNKSTRNKSDVVGVSWVKKRNKWLSSIWVNKNQLFLGRFDNFIDAVKARWQAEVKYDFPNCNSTSTAYLYLKKHGEI